MIDWTAILTFTVFSLFTVVAIFTFLQHLLKRNGPFGTKTKRR